MARCSSMAIPFYWSGRSSHSQKMQSTRLPVAMGEWTCRPRRCRKGAFAFASPTRVREFRAGSGKTRVLTTRIAWLIRHHGVDPSRILAVTFTNKAAGEMRERIAQLLAEESDMPGFGATSPEAVRKMWCGTFHAIGARMLRSNAHRVGRTANFTIYDEDDTLAITKRVMERVGVSPKKWTPKSIASLISDAKNA